MDHFEPKESIVTADLRADRDWLHDALSNLLRDGFAAVPLQRASDTADIAGLIQNSVRAFLDFAAAGAFVQPDFRDDRTGQAGVVVDGGEGDGSVNELRSHVVVPWSVEREHPLSGYWPYFYSASASNPEIGGENSVRTSARVGLQIALEKAAALLIRRLQRLTYALFCEIEALLALPTGSISDPIRYGEGILRCHYYPPLASGPTRLMTVKCSDRAVTHTVREVAPRSYQTWVSPHADIGLWTWQIAASDARLAFDRSGGPCYPQDENVIVGNVCTYLSECCPNLFAPVHWVDLSRPGPDRRWSIAYFAHARPAVRMKDVPAGERLYRDLAALGYGGQEDVKRVREMLASPELSDEAMLKRIGLFEENRLHARPHTMDAD